MKPRDRVAGIGRLLDLKHELDLQALAHVNAQRTGVQRVLSDLDQQLAARAGADDISAMAGNDAVWAARAAVQRHEKLTQLQELDREEALKRRQAELSFGRTDVFRKLAGKLEV
jgi:hypothetical protein